MQVYFELPNSEVPKWCNETVVEHYEKLDTLIEYTRDALSYRDYIDSITKYACDNYAANLD